MPRKRLPENIGLPSRWQFKHGAYYYAVPTGMEYAWDNKKRFRLGAKLPEAYKAWAERIGGIDNVKSIGDLLDRYSLEIIPQKAVSSHGRETRIVKQLRGVFGAMPLMSIQPSHIYRYVDMRSKKDERGEKTGLSAARHEIALLSHAYTKAVQWGYINRHPFKGQVRLEMVAPRDRYVEDWEIIECLALSSTRKKGSILAIQAYIRLKLLTGLRGGDMLRLKTANLKDDGIHVQTRKTGKPVIYMWSDQLRDAVQMAIKARPVDISPFVFCNKWGQGYFDEKKGTSSGWDSMWQRFMERVLAETKVKARFTGHDLRAKCASDAETLEHARSLLAHADSKITQKVYRRKPEIIKPTR